MRALLLALGLVTSALLAGTARADFDHNLHDRDIAVSGSEAIACTACHAMKAGALIGKPDHGSCFGTCHGAPPRKGAKPADVAPAQQRMCGNCHAANSAKALYPPYQATDFALAMPHKGHKDVACGSCHFVKTKAPHARCAGCHDGARAPTMSRCAACHTPGSGSPLPPRMREPFDTVTSEFSHPAHAARGAAGAECTTCHAELLGTDDSLLPRPKMKSCGIAGCHDAKAAFSVNVACTRCHSSPPPRRFEVERPTERYLHATTHKDVKLPCSACHPLAATGEPLVTGHQACVPCHEERFAERRRPSEPVAPGAPKQICGACHSATEPWRKLTADRRPPERTEFGATLSHDKHPRLACAACHSLTTATVQLRPPRGHQACTGAACHAVKGGPAPELTACESCHELGLATKREQVRATVAWSVRATFDHGPHPGECASCHDDLHGDGIIALAAPKKPSCAPCHDGGRAFKLTGTTCTRCHVGAKKAPVSTSR
ncbi:MAG: hypothetical protein JNL83_22725 [Myxococcales bacterium]|nr:hypothetical protein [Myxococcales bacterium]